MANTKTNAKSKGATKSKAVTKTNSEKNKEIDELNIQKENEDLKNKNIELEKQVNEIQSMLKKLTTEKQESNVKVIDTTSRFDKFCSLIHLLECPPNLPTTITVNGQLHMFTSFGQKRAFRFIDMQNITTKYRSWFERGVFTLGSDCDEFINDFGLSNIVKPMPVEVYRKIEKLDIDKFKDLVENLVESQRIFLAKTWIQRYNAGKRGYDDIDKIRVLNKASKGLLKNVLASVATEE